MKIISGGQTGVDRAALDAALAAEVEVGGWCPEGRLAEDGPIPASYPLEVLPGAGYTQRTRQNVIDSDGTAIIYFGRPTGGTANTIEFCRAENKPHLLIDGELLSEFAACTSAGKFVANYSIEVLNVAGPRASGHPEAYSYAFGIVSRLLAATVQPPS